MQRSVRFNLTGQRFSRLLALEYVKAKNAWRCLCQCGTEKYVNTTALRQGKIISCGCARDERVGAMNLRHGATHSPEYTTWRGMKGRCLNPKASQYPYYGGRGITICQRWLDSFEAFLADMGTRPPGMTLDRILVDGNYEPGNCRWATPTEQVTNSGTALRLTHNGITDTAAGWGRRLGMRPGFIRGRLFHGWSVERALTEPPHDRGQL